MRVLLAGGAGFIGSHMTEQLLGEGHSVVVVDNYLSGRLQNIAHLAGRDGFVLVEHDVTEPVLPALAAAGLTEPFDWVLHLASPASPTDFKRIPLEILAVGADGTRNLLEVARAHGSRFLLASTSEVYGDPMVHPQPEGYWGNVDSIGPRSCYDEAKRYAEALTSAYRRVHGVDTAIVRIFNTYGPRMRPDDGRVLTNFITQALRGEPLTVYGDGQQTRSFCFVTDEVQGLLTVVRSGHQGPVNVGNPAEITMLDLARTVIELTGSASTVVTVGLPAERTGDPQRRCPDISLVSSLGWQPSTDLRVGLAAMIAALTEELA